MGRFSNWWRNVGSADYSGLGDEDAESGTWDIQYDDPTYPGPREHRINESDDRPGPTYAVVSIKNMLNYEAPERYAGPYLQGGKGLTMNCYSTGVVDPSNVDAHDFTGGMVVVRRWPDTNFGPVQTSDHNSLLSLLYSMQESTAFYPNEASQIDMVKSV